jgi:hypothetical protein
MGNRSNQPFFSVAQSGDHATVHIQGGSYRIGDLAQLKVALELLETKQPKSIAFIFDGQSVLDSGFLNLMARTVYLQSQTGNSVFVVSQASHMLESLQVLGLDRVVTIVPDENAYQNALLHLGDSNSP